MLKMLVRKLIFSTQIILFFDKDLKKLLLTIIFTNIYYHLYSLSIHIKILRNFTSIG